MKKKKSGAESQDAKNQSPNAKVLNKIWNC